MVGKGEREVTRDEFCEAAWTELHNIEQGKVTIQMKEGDILSGPVKYESSTGWTIVAFSDGDVWDYVRKMIPPTGEAFAVEQRFPARCFLRLAEHI